MKLLIAAAALAAVCAPALASAHEVKQSPNDVKHVKYACDGNQILDVVFVNSDADSTAVIAQGGELVALKQAVSGSGVRYVPVSKDYTYELVGKGNEMTLYTHDNGAEQVALANCKS